jgi:hypothetical protein
VQPLVRGLHVGAARVPALERKRVFLWPARGGGELLTAVSRWFDPLLTT